MTGVKLKEQYISYLSLLQTLNNISVIMLLRTFNIISLILDVRRGDYVILRFNTRIFTKTKCQVSSVVKYIKQSSFYFMYENTAQVPAVRTIAYVRNLFVLKERQC